MIIFKNLFSKNQNNNFFNKIDVTKLDEHKSLKKYKRILIRDVCDIGIATKDIKLLINQITKQGGPGLYKVVFPKEVSGKLANSLKDTGYISNIVEPRIKGIKGRAILKPEPPNPSTIFIAIAIYRIEKELYEIKTICNDIFEKIVDNEHNSILSDYKSLINIYKNYKFNHKNERWLNGQFYNCIDIVRNSYKLFSNIITNLKIKLKDLKGIINEHKDDFEIINIELNYLQLSLLCYCIGEYYQLLLKGNCCNEEIIDFNNDLKLMYNNYKDIMTQCFNKYKEHLNKLNVHNKIKDIAITAVSAGISIVVCNSAPIRISQYLINNPNELDEKFSKRLKELDYLFKELNEFEYIFVNENLSEFIIDDKYIYMKTPN